MIKQYAGKPEGWWNKKIRDLLTSSSVTSGHKNQKCIEIRRLLEAHGDWNNFPAELKMNVTLYGNLKIKEEAK